MSATAETTRLTRAEDAYAHLASFQRGQRVTVSGPRFYQEGIVTFPLREDGPQIEHTFLLVEGDGVLTSIMPLLLTAGRYTITSLADAKAGNVRYFDEAGYAAQNSGQR
jgi:hypothetical protein